MCSNETIQWIKDFNKISGNASKNENNICKVLRPLASCEDLNLVDRGSIQTNMWFMNLHKELSNLAFQKKGVLLDYIMLLSKVSSNKEIRNDIVQKYKFVQVLANSLLIIGDDTNTLCRLLTLLQELTFDQQQLYLEENCLRMIIPFLVRFLHDSESEVFKLSLAVLVNICYKDKLASYILSRNIGITKLVLKIKGNGILSYKMYLLLEGYDCILPRDLLHFIRMSMEEIKKALLVWDYIPVKHCLDIYLEITGNSIDFPQNIIDFPLYVEDLLKSIFVKLEQTSENDDSDIVKIQFFNEFYQLLGCFLNLDYSLVSEDGFQKIMMHAIKDFNSKSQLKLIILQLFGKFFRTTVEQTAPVVLIRDKLFSEVIEKFISSIDEFSCHEQTEFLKLISTLARTKMFNSDVEKTYPPLFQKMFSKLKDIKNYNIELSKDNILFFISALCALVEFSDKYPKFFFAQMEETFKLDMIPFILAKAQLLGDEATCYTILKLVKLSEFPTKKVAHIYSQCHNAQYISKPTSTVDFVTKNKIEEMKSCHNSVLEQKLESLISTINDKLDKNEINSVLTSNAAELYRHKINLLNNRIDNLLTQIQLSADVNLASANDVHAFKMLSDRQEIVNFQLQIYNEKMSAENIDLIVATQALKKSASEFKNKIENRDGKITTLQEEIFRKKTEFKQLQTEFESAEIRNQNDKKTFKALNDELLAKIEGFKKEVKQFDNIVRDKDTKLKECEAENTKMTSKIVNMEKEISKLNATIKRAESDLNSRTEQLEQREQDLKASEEIYNNIMAIMQAKTKFDKK